MHNPEYVLENETHKLLWDFEIQADHQISARRSDLIIINKKENLQYCGLCCPGRVKLKECEKMDKHIDLGRKFFKKWNLKVTFIPIVIGALDTVTKGLIKGLVDLEIRGRGETIQTTTLLRSVRIQRRVLET